MITHRIINGEQENIDIENKLPINVVCTVPFYKKYKMVYQVLSNQEHKIVYEPAGLSNGNLLEYVFNPTSSAKEVTKEVKAQLKDLGAIESHEQYYYQLIDNMVKQKLTDQEIIDGENLVKEVIKQIQSPINTEPNKNNFCSKDTITTSNIENEQTSTQDEEIVLEELSNPIDQDNTPEVNISSIYEDDNNINDDNDFIDLNSL